MSKRKTFTDTEDRAFRRGRPVEFRDTGHGARWIAGVVQQKRQTNTAGWEYITVVAMADGRRIREGETIECLPDDVRPD